MTAVLCGSPVGTMEKRAIELGVRWCFNCRAHNTFHDVLYVAEREPTDWEIQSGVVYMWPEPRWETQCSVCRRSNADLFPGYTREWC